jgi:hypothetical protein
MSSKHINAITIEHDFSYILDYGIKDKALEIEEGISADFFDQYDNIDYLRKAVQRAINELKIDEPYRGRIFELMEKVKTIPFEKAAELWETIVILLKFIKVKI